MKKPKPKKPAPKKKSGFMPPPPPPAKKLRGAARMKEFGYHLVNVWLDGGEHADVLDAAKIADKPVATFIRESAVKAAQALIQANNANRAASGAAVKKMNA